MQPPERRGGGSNHSQGISRSTQLDTLAPKRTTRPQRGLTFGLCRLSALAANRIRWLALKLHSTPPPDSITLGPGRETSTLLYASEVCSATPLYPLMTYDRALRVSHQTQASTLNPCMQTPLKKALEPQSHSTKTGAVRVTLMNTAMIKQQH